MYLSNVMLLLVYIAVFSEAESRRDVLLDHQKNASSHTQVLDDQV